MTGGAVAICGASATLAIAAVIPHNDKTERNVLFTVVAVTTLSTIAMVIYPILFGALGFEDREVGFLIGATIHDVAQVVGAGYSVSDVAGDAATVVKLLRVAFLPVVLMAIVLALRGQGAGGKVPLLPWFMLLFIALSALGSLVSLPAGHHRPDRGGLAGDAGDGDRRPRGQDLAEGDARGRKRPHLGRRDRDAGPLTAAVVAFEVFRPLG